VRSSRATPMKPSASASECLANRHGQRTARCRRHLRRAAPGREGPTGNHRRPESRSSNRSGPTVPDMAQRRSTAHWLSRTWEERRLEDAHRVLAKVRRRRASSCPPTRCGCCRSPPMPTSRSPAGTAKVAGHCLTCSLRFAGQLSTNGGATVDGPVSHFLGGLLHRARALRRCSFVYSRRPPCSTRGPGHLLRCPDRPPLGQMLAERGLRTTSRRHERCSKRACTLATTTGTGASRALGR